MRTGYKRKTVRRIALFAVLLAVGYGLLAAALGGKVPFLRREATQKHGWNLILVNERYSVPADYSVELVTLGNGQQVDSRIYPDLQQMFDTMRSQGVYPIVASGYRTEERQRRLLEDKISEYSQMGHSWWKAREEALHWVSRPGTSEHQLGIAVDINQEGTRSTAKQVYGWLEENAHLYGFIYRYPEDKTQITGIRSEPWHYRYVGREAAQEIHERDLCLEEYLEERDRGKDMLFFY